MRVWPITGEEVAAFPVAPHVPGLRALLTDPSPEERRARCAQRDAGGAVEKQLLKQIFQVNSG